jgi:excisionase family DNA binding protein
MSPEGRPEGSEAAETRREVLTIEEAAELLGVSVKTFNKVLHSENIPGRKIGREWKFSRQALIEWIGAGRSDQFYREPREIRAARNGRDLPPAPEPPGARRTSGWRVKLD